MSGDSWIDNMDELLKQREEERIKRQQEEVDYWKKTANICKIAQYLFKREMDAMETPTADRGNLNDRHISYEHRIYKLAAMSYECYKEMEEVLKGG